MWSVGVIGQCVVSWCDGVSVMGCQCVISWCDGVSVCAQFVW